MAAIMAVAAVVARIGLQRGLQKAVPEQPELVEEPTQDRAEQGFLVNVGRPEPALRLHGPRPERGQRIWRRRVAQGEKSRRGAQEEESTASLTSSSVALTAVQLVFAL